MPTPIPAGITLETVMYNGPSKDKKNLLFLADGFSNSANDRKRFDDTIREIEHRFFQRPPFNLKGVKKMFNIFQAFTPAASSGISCAVPIDANGFTIPDNSGAGASIGNLIEKQSALGMTYGVVSNGTPMPRLIGPKAGDANLIANFIATLRLPYEAVADSAIPACWATPPPLSGVVTGKDFGLVVVLINDDKYGGGGAVGYATVALGESTNFHTLLNTAMGTDHVPGSPRNNFNNLTAVMHHELGHTYFKLKDEYAEIHTPGRAAIKDFYKENPNVVTKADITNGAGNIDPTLIKWNKPAFLGSADKIVGAAAFAYMQANNKPLWERPAGTVCANIGYDGSTQYPDKSIWNKIQYPQRIIGIYEGGAREGCGVYRPAGSCRMQNTLNKSISESSDFCYVCKHAIIEKIDPSLLEELYKRFYPRP
jgi:hypothetical protein